MGLSKNQYIYKKSSSNDKTKALCNRLRKTFDDFFYIYFFLRGRKVEQNRRYCPKCDDDTVKLRTGPNGFFWGCMNFRSKGCSFTQPKDTPPAARPLPDGSAPSGQPVDYSLESLIAQEQTRDTVPRGTAELNEWAVKRGMASTDEILQQLGSKVPGFGTVAYDQMSVTERHQRAAVLGEYLGNAVRRMIQPLPYDKNTPQAG